MNYLKFSKKYRINSKNDIKLLFEKGKSININNFKVKYLINELPHSRILICIKKKFGNAPKRNRVKRLIRESFRQNNNIKIAGVDMAIFCYYYKNYKIEDINNLWNPILDKI